MPIKFNSIFYVIGLLLSVLSIAMIFPAMVDAYEGHEDWKVFASSSFFTFFMGIMLILSNRAQKFTLDVKQAFILTTLSWVVLTAFAALPFSFSELRMNYTNSFFEAMSGMTTTGSTVITNLDAVPPGILLWRAILQWLGGIGIIVMAVAILPFLQVGGMQLFRTESSDKSEKILPSASQMAATIGGIYLFFTVAGAFLYWMAGMEGFSALCHSMTTIATGGYSVHDKSIGYYDNYMIYTIATFLMIIGSLPFIQYLKFINGNRASIFKDNQIRWFLYTLAFSIFLIFMWNIFINDFSVLDSFFHTVFNVTSVMTGTGYATAAFDQWGTLPIILLFHLMFVGGCAGSTTCGVKIFRFQVLYETAKLQIYNLLEPKRVVIAYYDGKPMPKGVPTSVMSFFFLFIMLFGVIAVALSMTGLDFITSISGAATSISNVGPGLGEVIGPEGNFSTLPDISKWILCVGMLLGRLELFTVLVLFVPAFWRQ